MLRSSSERRLWSAIRTASSANRVEQTLLLDELHRDLFLDKTRLRTLTILDGLVTKTPPGSGFHLVLLEHEILNEIIQQIECDPDSIFSRYSREMIGTWRYETSMTAWAQTHYYDSFEVADRESRLSGSLSSTSSNEDTDLIKSWFYKFQTDLLSVVDYMTISDQPDLIQLLQTRIQTCLQEIDQEHIVKILLQINDMCHMVLANEVSAMLYQDLDSIRLRISSLQYGSGHIHCPQDQLLDCSGLDLDSSIIHEEGRDQQELSAMFKSLATRDEKTESEQNFAGDDIDMLIQRFDPVFGNR